MFHLSEASIGVRPFLHTGSMCRACNAIQFVIHVVWSRCTDMNARRQDTRFVNGFRQTVHATERRHGSELSLRKFFWHALRVTNNCPHDTVLTPRMVNRIVIFKHCGILTGLVWSWTETLVRDRNNWSRDRDHNIPRPQNRWDLKKMVLRSGLRSRPTTLVQTVYSPGSRDEWRD